MTYLLIHADQLATILTDDPIVPAGDLDRLRDGLDLLGKARGVHDAAVARVAAAEAGARALGHADGLAEGRAIAEGEGRERIFALAVKAAEDRRRLRADVTALAIEVVRRIAGQVGSDTMVAALADRAAAELLPDQLATIRVAPRAVAETRRRIGKRPGLQIEADDRLDANDCVVETALGRTHAGLDTQLATIARALAAAAARPPEPVDGD